MVIKEITPPVERVFEMEIGGKELAVIRKALQIFKDKEKAERIQQSDYATAMAEDSDDHFIPVASDEAIADHLLANIRHTERAGFPIK
jgi:hypothetical protein